MKCCGILYLPGALGCTRIPGGVVTGYYRLQPSYSGSEFPRLTCKSHDKNKPVDLWTEWTQWTQLGRCGYSVHFVHSVQREIGVYFILLVSPSISTQSASVLPDVDLPTERNRTP